MFLSGLFSRFSDTQRFLKRRRSVSSSRSSQLYEASMEQLEQKRLLTVEYYGITHSDTTATAEDFVYQVGVTAAGTGELHLRYNQLKTEIQFSADTSFLNTRSMGIIPSGFSDAHYGSTDSTIEDPTAGGFSLQTNAAVAANWNGTGSTNESFQDAGLAIHTEPGTKVFVTNGDAFPIALFIGGNGGIARRSPTQTADGVFTPFARDNLPFDDHPDLIEINGPISNSNPWVVNSTWYERDEIEFSATKIIVDAEINTDAAEIRAENSLQLQNKFTSAMLNTGISTGDWHLFPGAELNSNVEIRTGAAGGDGGAGYGFGGDGGDILIDGTINAGSINLQTNSSDRGTHIKTGPSGLISGNNSLTVFNAGLDGGTIDIQTKNYSVTNVNVGGPTTGELPDIGISIDQIAGDLTIAAVPSSKGQISLKASGGANAAINVDAGISTVGGLRLEAGSLNINSVLDTETGNIELYGNSVSVGGNVHAGSVGVGNVRIESNTAGVSLGSAATIQADTGTIKINAATSIQSTAILDASLLDLTAGSIITADSNADRLRSAAGAGITIDSNDDLIVEFATSQNGNIEISSNGELQIQSVAALGTGNITISGGTGVDVNRLRTVSGAGVITASQGAIDIDGDVTIQGEGNDFSVSAVTGDIIVNSTSTVSVADQIALSAPKGRILTPGQIVGIELTPDGSGGFKAGSGYSSGSSINVNIKDGGGATASPVLTNGGIASIKLIEGGSGYVTPPSVLLIGGGGTNASAEATIDFATGVITSVEITNVGANYTSVPEVRFTGGSGQGAIAEALLNGVLEIDVTTSGSNYLTPPEVIISAGEGATSGPVSVDENGVITSIHLGSAGRDFGQPPNIIISDSSGAGSGASAIANLVTGVTSSQIRQVGDGYAAVPAVTVTDTSGSGSGAVIEATIAGPLDINNVLFLTNSSGTPTNGIEIPSGLEGTGYSPDVTVQITGGGGQGATATVLIDGSIGGLGLPTGNVDPYPGGAGSYSVDPAPGAPIGLPTSTIVGGTLGNLVGPAGTVTVNITPEFQIRQEALTLTPGTLTYAGFSSIVRRLNIYNYVPGYGGQLPFVRISIDPDTNLPSGIIGLDDPGQVVDGLEFFDPTTGVPIEFALDGDPAAGTISLSADRGFELSNGGTWDSLSIANSGFQDHPWVFVPQDPSIVNQVAGWYNLTVSGPLDASNIALNAAGVGYSSSPDVRFIDSSHTGIVAEAEAYVNGSLQSLRVVNPGKFYDADNTVIDIEDPDQIPGFGTSNGIEAKAKPRFSDVIESISVTNGGSNYNPATTSVSLDLVAGGSGAVVSPVQVNTAGEVLGVNVATPGIDYVTPPEVSINDLSNAGQGATGTAVLGVGLADLIQGGTGYQTSADNIPVWLNTTDDFGDKSFGVASTNASGEITSVEILQAGEGYLAKAELTSTINLGTGAVTLITPTIRGAGYTPGDTLDLEFEAPPAGGTLPSGWTATIGPNGQIETVNPGTAGLLYNVAPAVSIAPPSAENQYFRIAGTNDALATVTSPLTGSNNDEVDTLAGAITINFAGSGYAPSQSNIPVLFEPSPTGDTAQGYATADGSGSIPSVTVTHGGSGYTSVPRLIIAPSNNALAIAPALLVGGAVDTLPSAITVNHGGSGYIADGTVAVSFEPSPTGDTATGFATAAGGVITNITVTGTGGSGYTSIPKVRIDPPAYDALATVSLFGGAVVITPGAITVNQGGSGYEPLATNLPVVFEASPTGTGDTARGFATANASGEIISITVTDGGSGYGITAPELFIAPPQSVRAYMSVVGVDMLDGGTGYDANQTVVEFITSGSGAKAVANLNTNNQVASVTMVSSGSGYTVDPIVRIAGYGEGAIADAQIDSFGSVENLGPGNGHNITVTSGGSNYAVAPEVEFDPSPAIGGVTAEGIAVIGNIVEIAGARLSWEALETPIPAFISQFSIIEVHLTGTGDLNLQADTGSLTIEGASTKDGNISISAPSLTISGDVEIGDYDSSRDHTISLTATVSDIVVDAQVGNLLEDTLIRTPLSTTISLEAAAGAIATGESGNGLIVGNTLSFTSQDSTTLNTDVSEVSGEVRQSRANISLTQNTTNNEGVVEDLVLTNLQATGGSIEVIGGAGILIGKVDSTETGSVQLSGTGVVAIDTGDGVADVIGNEVLFYASTVGGINLDTEVSALTVAAIAGSVRLNQVGFSKTGSSLISTLEIIKVMASQDVTITATSPVKANYIEASGGLSLTTDNATKPFESFNVELGSIAVDDEITINADGNITSFAPLFEEPIIAAPLPPPAVEPAFLLSFDFDSALPASVVNASYAAAYRWAEIITANLDDVVDNNGFLIDDIHIEVNAGLLGGGDSPGGTLANARPLAFRSDTGIPYLGEVGVDLNDINDPGLIAIMTHEFGHVLGMPSASGFSSQISGDYFTGTNAVREYNTIFGQSADPAGVPLDSTGGPGTAGAHWSYPVFGQELMVGYLTSNPVISAVTVGAMQDIGYEVNYSAADPYTPPSSLSGIHSIPSDLSGLRPCGCAFCIPVSLTSSFALEQEELITTETLRVIANDISGTSGERSIDLKTNVSTFAALAGGNITIEESSAITLGETIDPLWLEVKSTSGSISVTAAGRITANNVHADHMVNGAIDLSSTASGVTLGTITTNTTNVTSSGDVLDMTGKIITSPTISIDATGSPIALTQNNHAIDIISASSETSATLPTRGNIGIKVAGNLDIDTVLGNEVTIIAENIVTDLTRIVANSLDVTSTKGGNIILDNLDNEIGAFGADARATVTATATVALSAMNPDEVDPTSVDVTGGGRGYVPNSTTIPVVFSAPIGGGGIPAVGLAETDANGVVIKVNISNPGSGYTTAPTVAINPPAITNPAGSVELISSLDNVSLIGIDAKNVTLSVNGNIADSKPTVAETLAIAAGGTVSLFELGNDIDILTIADTAVDRVTIDNGGTEYTPLSSVGVTFSDPTSVKKVKIDNIGSGYGTNEEYIPVTFTAPLDSNGVTTLGYATANAAGEIESVTITNPGSGYVTLPTVTIDGAGTLAAASVSYERPEGTAQVDANGVIESITITKAGFGYSTTPSVVIDSPPTSLTATQATATASNLTPTAVTFVDADDLEIGPGGLYAGDANLQVGGTLSQVADGEIQVTSLTVTSAADLDLTTAVNAVDVLSVASSGFDVDFRNNADLEISSSGLTANDVSITLAGDLTQDLTGTIDVNELQVLGNRGKIDLISATNEIDKVGASGSAHTANNNQRVTGISFTGGTGYGVNQSNIPVTFGDSPTGDTATGYITADASGVITPDSLTITNPGSGYKTAPAVTITAPNGGSAPSATSEIAFHDITINNSVATIIDGLEATGGAITISSTGTVTQSGQIIAKSLSVTSDVGIQLDTSTNNVNEFSATSDTDNVTYYDAGDVEVGSIKGVNIELNTIGSLTQTPSGSIEGTTLSITGSRDVTLTSTANDVDTIQASGIYLANADGFGLDYTDVDDLIVDGVEATAGSISITSGGTQTISNRVVAGAATAHATATLAAGGVDSTVTIDFDGAGYQPAARATATAAVTGGAVDLLPTITGGGAGYTPNSTTIPVTFDPPPAAPGAITAIGLAEADVNGVITSINVTNPGSGYGVTAPTVTIDPPTSIPVTFSAPLGGGPPAEGVALADPNGVITEVIVTNPGSGYSIPPTVTIAPPTLSSGRNIVLDAQGGDLVLNADVIAEGNKITLKATTGTISNGTIPVPGGKLLTETLVWYATTPFNPVPNSFTHTIEGPNLTAPGDLDLDRLSLPSVTFAGASVVDGFVSIRAHTLTLNDLVRAAGTGNAVTIETQTGSVTLTGDGRLESESGDIIVSAATSLVVNNPTVTHATATAGTLVIKQPTATATVTGLSGLGEILNPNVTVSFPGKGYTQNSTTIPVMFDPPPFGGTQAEGVASVDAFGFVTNISLTNPGAGYDPLALPNVTISDPTFGPSVDSLKTDVQKIDVIADSSLNIVEANDIEIVRLETDSNPIVLQAGGITQTGALIAPSLTVTNVAGDVVLDSTSNDVQSIAIANAAGDVTYTSSSSTSTDIAAGGIQAVNVALNTANGITQSGAIVATSLDVTNSAGTVVLDQSNSLTNVEIDNTGRDITLINTAATNISAGGIQGDTVVLNTAGLTQTGAITATDLAVTNTAGTVVLDQNNVLTSVGIINTGRDITLTDTTATDISAFGIEGDTVVFNIANGLTQTGAIVATSLDVTNTVAGNVVLDQNNDVAMVAIANEVGDVTYNTNRVGLTDIAGIQGVNVDLDSENGITQSGAITATNSLIVTNTVSEDVVLDQNNDAASVTITNIPGDVTYTTISSSITDINGIQGVNIVLNTDHGVSQSAAITATNSLTVTNAVSGNVVLDQNNVVATVAITNTVGDVTYTTISLSATEFAGIQGVNIDLNSENGITQSGAITATSLDVTNAATGSVLLADGSNDVDSLTVINTTRAITYSDSDDVELNELDGSPITINAGGNVTQVSTIQGTDLIVTAGGEIDLDTVVNSVDTFTATSTDSDITLSTDQPLVVAAPGIDAGLGNIGLTVNTGDLTQLGELTAASLALIVTDGNVVLNNALNDVDSIAALVEGTNRSFTFNDKDDLIIGSAGKLDGIVGENIITLTTGGHLTQTNSIQADSLKVSNTGGDITLINPDNQFDFLEAQNSGRSISILSTSNSVNAVTTINGTGIEGNTVNLVTEGIAQTAPIKASFLDIQNSSNAVVLNDSNEVANIEIASAGNPIGFTNTVVTNISTGGIQGTSITLNTVGLEQDGAIQASNLLDITNTSGNVWLDQQNTATSFSIDNDTRGILFTAAEATTIAAKGIQGSSVILDTAGLTQSGAITATSLDVTNSADAVVLTSATNSLTNVEIDNTGNSVSFTNSAATNISPGGIQGSTVVLNTAGLTQSGAISATSLDVTNSVGAVVLTDAANSMTNVEIDNTGNSVNFTNAAATNISAGGIQGSTVVLNTAGLTQSGAISATSLDVTNSVGAVVLTDAANSMTNVEIDNTGNSVSFTNAAATNISAGGIQGSTVVLNTAGLTQSGAISATSLDVTNSVGAVVLTDAANSMTNVEIDNTGNSVSFTNAAATNISAGGIQGSIVVLNTAGITQSGAISTTSLDVTNSADDVVLTNAANSMTNVEIDNTGNDVSFINAAATNISAGGIQGSFVTLNTVGLTQTGEINASAKLTVTNTQGDVTLTENNKITAIELANPLGKVDITNATSMSVNGNGISGNSVSIDITGDLIAIAEITSSTSFDAEVSGQASFTSVTASGGSLEIDAGSDVSVQNSLTTQGDLNVASDGTVTLNQISAPVGSVTISGGGAVELGQVSTQQGSVTITGGSDTTLTGTTSIGTDLIIDSAGSVEIADATVGNKGTIQAIGDVEVGTKLETTDDMIIDATGGFYVSTLNNGVAKSSTEIDLRNVDGDVRLINGGIITAPSVLLREGAAIGIGAPATMPSSLEDAFARLNDPDDLPTLPNAPYEIVVSDNVQLRNTITVDRPVIIRGGTNDASISGTITVDDGLLLSSNASGSTISNLTFANFSGTALTLDNVTDTVVDNNVFKNGGKGIYATGTLTNTTARGNVFESLGKGLDLDQATAFTFGGSTVGEPNEMKDTTLGIYADGDLVGTKLLKTKFAHDMASYKRRDLSRARNYVLSEYSSSSVTRTLEESGDVHLKEDDDGKLYANNSPVLYGSTHFTVSYFAGWTAVAVEDFGAASGDKQLVLRHSTGSLLTWQLDDSWKRSGQVDFVAASDIDGINAKEIGFSTDFDGDTDIGLTNLETSGSTHLKQDVNGRIYANNSPILYSTTHITVSHFAGWTAVAVEDFGAASGNKQLVLQHSNESLLTWQLDDNWRRSGQVDYTAATSLDSFNAKETKFNTDIDKDGDTGLSELETDGNVLLKQDADGKIYANNNPILYSTTHITVSHFAGWTAVAVEDFGSASDGKQLVLQHSNGSLLTWQLDDNWKRSGQVDYIAATSLDSFNAKETKFNTDIDKDGDTGLSELETSGGIFLKQDAAGLIYANSNAIIYSLTHITVSHFAGWTAVAVEDFGSASGGKQLLLQHANSSLLTWQLNDNWERSGQLDYVSPNDQSSTNAKELAFSIDLDGDGDIGI